MKTIISVACLLAMSSLSHAASLVGHDVNLSAYSPDEFSLSRNYGNSVVSPNTEPEWLIDSSLLVADIIDGSLLAFTVTNDDGILFGRAPFNGFVLEILSDAIFLSANVASDSDFNPIDIGIDANGKKLVLNFAGVSYLDGRGSSIINFTTENVSSIPIPATLWLFGSALLGLVGLKRKK